MKKIIIAAFLWDTNHRAISFMIIDNHFQPLVPPEKHNLGPLSFVDFSVDTAAVIDSFFAKALAASREHGNCPIRIEYKILHSIVHAPEGFYQPSSRSDFVKKQFMAALDKLNKTDINITLSQQLRTRLRKPELDRFKNTLRTHHIVQRKRDSAYQFHLWILATHATKGNYTRVIKRLLKYRGSRAA